VYHRQIEGRQDRFLRFSFEQEVEGLVQEPFDIARVAGRGKTGRVVGADGDRVAGGTALVPDGDPASPAIGCGFAACLDVAHLAPPWQSGHQYVVRGTSPESGADRIGAPHRGAGRPVPSETRGGGPPARSPRNL